MIATAIGIAVAVPAVIAYNFFIRRNKVVLALLDDFATDFVHLALKTSFIIKRPISLQVPQRDALRQEVKKLFLKNYTRKGSTSDGF